MSDARPHAWQAGARFSTYEIDSLLAAGGMAEVWRAKIVGMEGFEKRIVIKTMLTQFLDRPDLVEMFISEASLAARLNHPNIVDVIDFGQLEGRYFIAMQYVPGMSLRFAIKRKRQQRERLPIPAVLHVARDVCEALQYMHDLEDATGQMGLVHRDLSPDNIIVSSSGTAKLIDFGAARATARTPPSPSFVGKFRYAAPERIRQDGEDPRSDIYSLGVILHECLTGVRPFVGSEAEVIHAVTTNPACDPRTLAPDVPPQVAEVVKKATAANPADRFASAQAMGTALARCLAAMGATNKEREVTGALATLLEEAAAGPPASERPLTAAEPSGSPPATLDAVPHLIRTSVDPFDGVEASSLVELEILEASGPIRNLAAGIAPLEPMPAEETRKMSIPLPPEAFPSRSVEKARTATNLSEAIREALADSRTPSPAGWRRAAGSTLETPASEHAVALFDQGLELRLQGRYDDALAAWEQALRLAPDNHLYQAQLAKLRAHLAARRGR